MLRMLTVSTCIFVLSMVFAIPGVNADTIYLKSGTRIEVANAWEENGVVRGELYGQIAGYPLNTVDHVEYDQEDSEFEGCTFDIWRSGMTVAEIIRKAELNDIPLHRDGLSSSNKHFNPKACRPYIKTAVKYSYRVNLLGQWATVRLQLTPQSKKLYGVTIYWSGTATSRQTGFRGKVDHMIVEKYGHPSGRRKDIIFKYVEWQAGENCRITKRSSAANIQLTYLDRSFRQLAEAEKRNGIDSGFSTGDKSKF